MGSSQPGGERLDTWLLSSFSDLKSGHDGISWHGPELVALIWEEGEQGTFCAPAHSEHAVQLASSNPRAAFPVHLSLPREVADNHPLS
ncbi:unnamed protein product [Calypogeia fissa]